MGEFVKRTGWKGLASAALIGLASLVATTASVDAQGASTCFGKPVTISGTAGNDVLEGTPGNDVIAGWAGNDTIMGGGGDDLICAGPGTDFVDGQSGADRIAGGKGRDYLLGGAGNDTILGGPGSDKLEGNLGNDVLKGESGDDIIAGSNGKDRLFGGKGNDGLVGGVGHDKSNGGPGGDECEMQGNQPLKSCETAVATTYQKVKVDVVGEGDDPTGSGFGAAFFAGTYVYSADERLGFLPIAERYLDSAKPFTIWVATTSEEFSTLIGAIKEFPGDSGEHLVALGSAPIIEGQDEAVLVVSCCAAEFDAAVRAVESRRNSVVTGREVSSADVAAIEGVDAADR